MALRHGVECSCPLSADGLLLYADNTGELYKRRMVVFAAIRRRGVRKPEARAELFAYVQECALAYEREILARECGCTAEEAFGVNQRERAVRLLWERRRDEWAHLDGIKAQRREGK